MEWQHSASEQRQLRRPVAETGNEKRETLMRPMASENNGHWSASVVFKEQANVKWDLRLNELKT